MKLSQVLRGVELAPDQSDLSGPTGNIDVTAVTSDSREAAEGSLFIAIPGFQTDGAKFAEGAAGRGSVAVVAEKGIELSIPVVRVADARAAAAVIAANFFGNPALKLTLAGVTGTSGKTTTTKMIESIFDATGTPVGLIGTIEYRAGEVRELADRTTPDSIVLHEWFSRMVEAGVRYAVMEVSSHALALKRTFGIPFAAAVFTNLSRDHFDFHRDFEDYFAAKKILFSQIDLSKRSAVVNIDDPYGERLARELGSAVLSFGLGEDAAIHPLDGFQNTIEGLRGTVATPWGEVRLESNLIGRPNLYNWLGAIGAALVVGIPVDQIEEGVRRLTSVRGRFERVPSSGTTVLIDYAHKPDALEKLLHAVRGMSEDRRITVVFGCGGDRDQGKRPLMGEIAARLADRTIITSDNPRTEKPEAIVRQIEAGARQVGSSDVTVVLDRREAIARAIAEAGERDVVLIAGKGHENYQVVGDEILHFDDREEAELALRKRESIT